MTLSVRLDAETKRILARLARSRRSSRSEVVRQAIHELAKKDDENGEFNPYELVKDLIGSVHGLPPDGSARVSDYFYEDLVDKKRKGRF
jgi:Arc/MetJ-type ribon-helix-helix transcriptional regulator